MKNANTYFFTIKMTYVGSRRLFNDSLAEQKGVAKLHIKSTQVLAENFVIIFFFWNVKVFNHY